ncbi:hypothetical protein [Paenibacillus methanolicus]|uniref:Uncharacterized protein n=1 Tax=Paenibacillus methanolicus TaxID=582686 RepID=A0A5S5BWT3_9BACL|nr:hypothetical protein [Paenibacillus methanolicus]TYP70093.1 hypothetical protein BCM02_11271 [Paenibacillus methanolicus]
MNPPLPVLRSADPKSQPAETARAERFERLASDVAARDALPEDRYAVAALLESMGWNDARAAEAFGTTDIFELAAEVWEAVRRKVVTSTFAVNEQTGVLRTGLALLKSFLRGVIFALPMAISVISMLTLKFSLWSYEHLSVEIATCIAIGTIASFVVVGGFTQAIARRGFFYISQGYYNMARKVTFLFIRLGYAAALVACALLLAFNLVFNVFPPEMFLYIVLYFFFLVSIWLSVTVMYILRRELTFTGLILAGIAIVYVLFRVLAWDIIFAQLLSILVVSAAGMALVVYYFRQAAKREEKGIAPRMPRLAVTVYAVAPYFAYGLLYFVFLFVDRIMAWSSNVDYMPYFIWFRGEYELGLDFALLSLMIPLGVCEVMVNKLMLDIEASYKRYWGFESELMNARFRRVYNRMMAAIAVSSALSALLIYGLAQLFDGIYYAREGEHLIASATTRFVFLVVLLAYVILATGLMNAVTLFSLSQPSLVNRAIVPALAVNVVLGFALSRWIDYSFAVFGVLAGAIVFSALSFRAMRQVLGKLDYYLYAIS